MLAALLLAICSACLAQEAASQAWLIPIDTEITPATAQFVASRVEQANEAQPLVLLFLIDTPGGQVSSMERIVSSILNDTTVPTVALVQNAFSAGALIAMSAEQLVMLPGSSIGAALPVTVGPTGVDAVGEKMSSAMRGQFRSVAEARGRNPRVAEAMVDQRIEIPGLSTSEELVTLTADQAVEHGIADLQASSMRDALQELGYGGVQVQRLERNLTERLAGSLSNSIVAAILLVIGIGGLAIELFSPGFGFPGAIGVVALALFAAGTYLATPASSLDLIILLSGLLLIALELLVIPGTGIAGLLGLLALLLGLFRIFQDDFVAVIGWTALFGSILLGFLLWAFPNMRMASPLLLKERLVTATGGADGERVAGQYDHLLGAVGTAMSDLRPAGLARIDGERVDVVSQGDFVSVGSKIEVIRVEGNRITVREVQS